MIQHTNKTEQGENLAVTKVITKTLTEQACLKQYVNVGGINGQKMF